MKLTISILFLFVASLAQGQTPSNCSVAYRAASKAAFDLQLAYTDATDPIGITRLSLQREGAAYYNAGTFADDDTQVVKILCTHENLATLGSITAEYTARIMELRKAASDGDNNPIVIAAQVWLHNHRSK